MEMRLKWQSMVNHVLVIHENDTPVHAHPRVVEKALNKE